MQFHKITIFLFSLALCPFSSPYAFDGTKPLVWFAPQSHYPPPKDVDFLSLFTSPGDWQLAAKYIDVVELSSQFFIFAPDSVVKEAIDYLKARNMRLAVAAEFQCNLGPTWEFASTTISKKIQRAGGTIAYLAMDEPLLYLYYMPSGRGCGLDFDKVLHRTKQMILPYLEVFPDIEIQDVEPFPHLFLKENWREIYIEWQGVFERATGRKIKSLTMDINWRESSLTSSGPDVGSPEAIKKLVKNVSEFASTQGLRVGIIYNGKASAKSDVEWLRQAAAHIDIIEAAGVVPHDVVFQSWHKYPRRLLPDANPNTFTGFIARNRLNKKN